KEDLPLRKTDNSTTHPWETAYVWYGEKDIPENKRLLCSSVSNNQWLLGEAIESAIGGLSIHQFNSAFLVVESFLISAALNNSTKPIADFAVLKQPINYDSLVFVVNTSQHPGVHWFIVIADIKHKSLVAIDSSETCSSIATKYHLLEQAFKILYLFFAIAGVKLKPTEWELILCSDAPQQINSYDCGVHSVINAYCVFNHIPLIAHFDSAQVRAWIKSVIINFSGEAKTHHSKNELTGAREISKSQWISSFAGLTGIGTKTYHECFPMIQKEKSGWTTCDMDKCTGNKKDETQVMCVNCRKWSHRTCLPESILYDVTYYVCPHCKNP
uniref:uncharacterized protein LOC120341208 n=1 Tax=Styela clava TaxID=7725 RepID=UPI00193A6435